MPETRVVIRWLASSRLAESLTEQQSKQSLTESINQSINQSLSLELTVHTSPRHTKFEQVSDIILKSSERGNQGSFNALRQ